MLGDVTNQDILAKPEIITPAVFLGRTKTPSTTVVPFIMLSKYNFQVSHKHIHLNFSACIN